MESFIKLENSRPPFVLTWTSKVLRLARVSHWQVSGPAGRLLSANRLLSEGHLYHQAHVVSADRAVAIFPSTQPLPVPECWNIPEAQDSKLWVAPGKTGAQWHPISLSSSHVPQDAQFGTRYQDPAEGELKALTADREKGYGL